MTLIIQKPTGAKLNLAKAPAIVGILDTYTDPAAAYSLRELTWRWKEQPVVRVRRSSDNTESDFTASQVSGGNLATWVGASNDGFVRTWYDQSGRGNNAVQATTSLQLKIVSSGSVITSGSQPALQFGGAGSYLSLQNGVSTSQDWIVFMLQQRSASGTNGAIFGNLAADNTYAFFHFLNNLYYGTAGIWSISASLSTTTNRQAITSDYIGSTFRGYINGTLSSGSPSAITLRSATLNSIGKTGSFNSSGFIQELIAYDSNQSASRASIESNINAHYGVY
jgi:hypothetical protein